MNRMTPTTNPVPGRTPDDHKAPISAGAYLGAEEDALTTETTWHADDCGGTCDGCGHIAADGFWYNAPCPDSLLAFQLEWAENGAPDAVRAE